MSQLIDYILIDYLWRRSHQEPGHENNAERGRYCHCSTGGRCADDTDIFVILLHFCCHVIYHPQALC
jgi:hypothetical protein